MELKQKMAFDIHSIIIQFQKYVKKILNLSRLPLIPSESWEALRAVIRTPTSLKTGIDI
jgi:hypothetical protein